MASRRFDLVVLALWLPVWLFAFSDSARHYSRPLGLIPIAVSGAARDDAFPIVTGQRLWAAEPVTEVLPGDRLLSLGADSLRGASALDVFLRFAEAARGIDSVGVTLERGGERIEASVPANPASFLRSWLIVSLEYAAVALLLLWRAPSSPMVRAFFQAFMATATMFAAAPHSALSVLREGLALGLTCALNLIAFQRFPHGDPPRSFDARAAPWVFLALVPLHTSRFGAPLPLDVAEPLSVAGVFSFFVALLAIATHNYRMADSIGRRQLRWLLFGIYLAALPPMLSAALIAADSSWTTAYALNLAAVGMIPLSLLISIIRFNLFDIDRVISAAASYNLLLILAFVTALVLAPQLGDLAAKHLSLSPESGRLAVAVLLTALLLPAQQALRPRLERLFFRERWDLDQGIARLIEEVRGCRNPTELTERMGEGLVRLLRPELCVVYARTTNGFAPVFVRGRAVPPGFAAEGSLVRELSERPGPLALEAWQRRLPLTPFERGALQSLGTVLLLPIHSHELAAIGVLGRKRSGDVYTSTDIALLARLTDQVGARLRGYDQTTVARESREMEEKLRRYVPGAVIQQLESGRDSVFGACEVSILFVDIRGYTSFAEGRRPEEIFSTLDRYTQLVSKLVEAQGGHVVEFHGDGLMAVFGAPLPISSKERAAVAAAREIVGALTSRADDAAQDRISVGVGIATGEAYVGDLRSVDRVVWSVVGNTTNLAARLQELTREWEAAIVIDSRTREAAGEVAAPFERREHASIRGRRQEEVLYVLPLPEAG